MTSQILDYDKIAYYYNNKLWNEMMVRNAVVKNIITPEQFILITGQQY